MQSSIFYLPFQFLQHDVYRQFLLNGVEIVLGECDACHEYLRASLKNWYAKMKHLDLISVGCMNYLGSVMKTVFGSKLKFHRRELNS